MKLFVLFICFAASLDYVIHQGIIDFINTTTINITSSSDLVAIKLTINVKQKMIIAAIGDKNGKSQYIEQTICNRSSNCILYVGPTIRDYTKRSLILNTTGQQTTVSYRLVDYMDDNPTIFDGSLIISIIVFVFGSVVCIIFAASQIKRRGGPDANVRNDGELLMNPLGHP